MFLIAANGYSKCLGSCQVLGRHVSPFVQTLSSTVLGFSGVLVGIATWVSFFENLS